MTRQEAKALLMSCRPMVDDDTDPRMEEALALLQSDPELASWYDNQRAVDDAIRRQLREMPVPADLATRILAGTPTAPPTIPWTRVLPRLAAAAAVIIAGGWWWNAHRPPTFERFARAMVHHVSGDDELNTHEESLAEVQAALEAAGWPADYVVPPALRTIPVEGGMLLRWRGHPVSVICLETETEDYYWLFVIDATALTDPPGKKATDIKNRDRFATAAWSEQGLSYMLVGEGIPDAVQSVLGAVVQQQQSE